MCPLDAAREVVATDVEEVDEDGISSLGSMSKVVLEVAGVTNGSVVEVIAVVGGTVVSLGSVVLDASATAGGAKRQGLV